MDRNLVVRSRRWESERREEANIPWVTQTASALQGISQKLRERERERETGTKALMEQRWFTQHGVGIYTVMRSLSKREYKQSPLTVWFVRRKRVLITVRRNAWIPQPKAMPLLLIPEYSGMNKAQRVPDRSKTAHRRPLVKCFLTISYFIKSIV